MTDAAPAPTTDPAALLRSREYRRLLVIAAVLGVFVSVASWAFLELIARIQHGLYDDLPTALGFDAMPWWWPLPVLAIAGAIAAVAVHRLPGGGGHVPYAGLAAGATDPSHLPGIVLAAVATLGFGLVLGPEGPLIAGATGLAVWAVRRARADTPDQAVAVLASAAAFAAIATVFGSPVIGTVILIEAAGIGGPMLTLVLLPGLMSAGIGTLVFTGIGDWSGLDSSSYTLTPFSLPAAGTPTPAEFGWTIVLAIVAAVLVVGIVELARRSDAVVSRRPFVLMPLVGIVIAGLAIGFDQATDLGELAILFSGQEAFGTLFADASTVSLGSLAILFVAKGLAWGLSLGSFRGGPTFPALFLGGVAGLMASHLPGMSETAAVAVLMGAMAVSMLRLPLSAVILTLLLTGSAGASTAPLVITSVVIAYLTTNALRDRIEGVQAASPPPTPS